MSVLEFAIHPMSLDERNLVTDSWMRSSRWRRSAILAAMRGSVLVARNPRGLALGWACHDGAALAYVWVKGPYRRLGLGTALYEACGRPVRAQWPVHGALAKSLAARLGVEIVRAM